MQTCYIDTVVSDIVLVIFRSICVEPVVLVLCKHIGVNAVVLVFL